MALLLATFLVGLVGCACDNPFKSPDPRFWRQTYQYQYCNVCGGEFARDGHCSTKQAGPWCPYCPYPTAPGLATRP
jgi:hypothetical protein